MNKGLAFEAALRKSWVASKVNLVRMKITETGEEKPCDERLDFKFCRVFNELKSIDKRSFNIKQLKLHQIRVLYHWHLKFSDSISLVSIEFKSYDTMFFIDIKTLILLSSELNKNSISIEEFRRSNNCLEVKKQKGVYVLHEVEALLNGVITRESSDREQRR